MPSPLLPPPPRPASIRRRSRALLLALALAWSCGACSPESTRDALPRDADGATRPGETKPEPAATGERAAGTEAQPRPNVLLVTLDTTRPDHLGPYGHAGARTPTLDRLAERADVYENAYATSSWTLASHASIFTGLLPRQHGAQSVAKGPNQALGYGVRPLAESFVTLAELLARAGYRTGAVIAGPALRRDLGTSQGFEFYADDLEGRGKVYNGRRAKETTNLALGILDRFGAEPWFLFVNYFDPHAPYSPPGSVAGAAGPDARANAEPESAVDANAELIRGYIEKLSEGEPARPRTAAPRAELAEIERQLRGYDDEIAYLDRHLGRLLDAIERSPTGRNTWVIITSDHGESFGEHYFMGHGANLYEDNVRVPLIVRAAGSASGRRISEPVQNHRLFGTILDVAGVERPEWAEPLPRAGEASEIVLEVHRSDSNIRIGGAFFDRDLVSLLAPPYKLIRSTQGKFELYDISRDPLELDDLLDRQPELAARLAAQLSEIEARHPPLYREGDAGEIGEETLEALRAMGYIE